MKGVNKERINAIPLEFIAFCQMDYFYRFERFEPFEICFVYLSEMVNIGYVCL